MKKLNEFFLSNVLNAYIYDELDDNIGKLIDIYVTTESGYPRAIGYKIKKGKEILDFEFRNIDIYKEKSNYVVKIIGAKDIIPRRYSYLLSKNLLDKQIVDINGKKIIKVNDLRMIKTAGEIRVLEVESGLLALSRRFGVESLVKGFYRFINKEVKDDSITWESVQSIEMIDDRLRLSEPYKKLTELHPVELAEIVEGLSSEDRRKIFESLRNDFAADTLEELETEIQIDILKNLSSGKAKEILDVMPNDEIADILEDMDDETKENLLINIDDEDELEIRDLMEYEDEMVGSIMNTDFISLNIDITASETIDILRALKPDDEVSHYIYIVDQNERLQGFISLRDLILADPNSKLKSIMNTKVLLVKDSDDIEKAVQLSVKYELYSLPVIDEQEKLCGVAVMNDIIEELLTPSWKRKLKKSS